MLAEQAQKEAERAAYRANADRQREAEQRERDTAKNAAVAANETDCASDRAGRVERRRLAEAATVAARDREKLAQTWLEEHCKKLALPTYERQLCDDGTKVAKWCTVQVAERVEYKCPAGAPAGVTKTGVGGISTAAENAAAANHGDDRQRNRLCQDTESR